MGEPRLKVHEVEVTCRTFFGRVCFAVCRAQTRPCTHLSRGGCGKRYPPATHNEKTRDPREISTVTNSTFPLHF
jgi:hypothetical protein